MSEEVLKNSYLEEAKIYIEKEYRLTKEEVSKTNLPNLMSLIYKNSELHQKVKLELRGSGYII